MAKSLYKQQDPKVKIRTRDLKIAVCVSLVWVISFLFLIVLSST